MQRHSTTSLETALSLANGLSWGVGGWGRSTYVFCDPRNCSVSYLSFVYGRRLTAGKILFTGRQKCSLYLVLWLCGRRSPYRFAKTCVKNNNSGIFLSQKRTTEVKSPIHSFPLHYILEDKFWDWFFNAYQMIYCQTLSPSFEFTTNILNF